MPAVPRLNLAFVDVRDVAKAHIEAMHRPETDGERILVGKSRTTPICQQALHLDNQPTVLLVP